MGHRPYQSKLPASLIIGQGRMGKEDLLGFPVSGCTGGNLFLSYRDDTLLLKFPMTGGGEVWADESPHTVEDLRVCTHILNVSSNGGGGCK